MLPVQCACGNWILAKQKRMYRFDFCFLQQTAFWKSSTAYRAQIIFYEKRTVNIKVIRQFTKKHATVPIRCHLCCCCFFHSLRSRFPCVFIVSCIFYLKKVFMRQFFYIDNLIFPFNMFSLFTHSQWIHKSTMTTIMITISGKKEWKSTHTLKIIWQQFDAVNKSEKHSEANFCFG